jgi:hypothetical protein
METKPASETLRYFQNWTMSKKKKRRRFLSAYLIPVLIYHLSTDENLVMQAMVWPCMIRFRAMWFSAS